MKFKQETWRALEPSPFHEGEYEVKLDTGEVIRALYQQQQWTQEPDRITAWRGRQIKGLNKPKRHRRDRSEEHTSELQSLMRISYAVFCLKKKTTETVRAHH